MLKRALSLCLSIAMVLSMVPAQAFAAETETVPAETVAETTVTKIMEMVTEPAGTTVPIETEAPETAAPTVAESVPETTLEETAPAATGETLPEETEETVPEASEETVPETTVETIPEETVEETVAEEAQAAGGTTSDGLKWDYTSGTLTISGSTSMSNYTSSSRPKWETYKSNITKVVIKSGVTRIGDYAFYQYDKLESVTIPMSVSKIGKYAFRGCTSLKTVEDLYNIEYILTGAFYQCYSLESIDLGNCLKELGSHAFKECTSLESVKLPWGITTLGDNAFSYCTGLKEVNLFLNPGQSCFEGCTALEKVYIYMDVTKIGYAAFLNCTGLKTITIPYEITSIGSYAFKNSGLKTILFEGNAPSIASDAFTGVSAKAMYKYGNTTWTSSKCANYGGSLSWSYDNRCGERAAWSLSNGVLTISGSGDMADYKYASDQPWYSSRSNITSIVIKSGITSIGDKAFSGCSAATGVTIAGTVTGIGTEAFYNCKVLTGVTIPSSVKTIGDNAFQACSAMTSLTLNSGLADIGKYAFQNCYKLTSVTLPESTATIGEYAFGGCTGLTSMTIPAGVTSIGGMAFGGCNGLTEIWVNPANRFYSSDDYGVFYDKNKTVLIKAPTCLSGSFAIPETVETIAVYAFDDCVGLTEVTIPDSVTEIEQCAFYYCYGLETVRMGSNVTTIGKQAFDNCTSLAAIAIPEGVTAIGANTFNKCSALESVTLPEGLTSIGTKAFYNCDNLETVSIPAAVTSIDSQAFGSCDSLTAIRVAEGNAKYTSDERGVLFNKDMTTLIQVPGGILDGYAIPHTVTSVSSYAFEDCKKLLAVYIPGNVASLTYYAFYGCSSGLVLYCEEYSVPGGWASDWSGSRAVKWGVDALEGAFWVSDAFQEQVHIPEYLSSLPDNAFYGHTNVKSITIPAGITALPAKAFYGCTALTKVNFPKRLTTIGDYAFYGCTGFKAFYIPATITTISANAFHSCDSYMIFYCEAAEKPSGWASGWNGSRKVIWGATAESSSFWTSEEAWKAHVVIPEGITEIPDYAFYNRKDLLSVTIPDSVTSIGQYAFYNCSGLTELPEMPGGTSIGSYAFGHCKGIKHLRIPSGVTTLGSYAFYGCTELLTVYIPASVTTVTGKPFYGCNIDLMICCEVPEKPAEWGLEWLEHGFSGYMYMQNPQYGINGITYDFFISDALLAANVVIPEGVTVILKNAFKDRTDLLSVTIPDSVTDIRESAFYGCTGLTEVAIPAAVTAVGDSAFYGCTGLKEVYLADGLGVIGNKMFYGCTGLTSVSIPGSVKTLGDYAFQGCTGLTNIDIGSGVTAIGKNTFRGCTGLTKVFIPASVTTMPGQASTITTYDPATGTHKTTGVIYSSPFFECSRSLILYCEAASKPSGWSSFWYAYGANFYAYTDYISYSPRYLDVIWGIQADNADFWMGDAQQPDVVIPESMTKIPDSAFDGRTDLKSVVIGSSVTEIGENAFRGCTGLTDVAIGENVTTIGASAFSGCTGLTGVTLGESVKTIGESAFSGCTGLKEILIPATVTKVGNGAFNSCSASLVIKYAGTMEQWMKIGYSPCTVQCSDGTIYGFGSCGSSAKWTVIDGVLRIYGKGSMANYNYTNPGWTDLRSSITSLVVDSGITSLGYYAFNNCKNLADAQIAATVSSVGTLAFYNCSALKTVTFQGSKPGFAEDSFKGVKATAYYPVTDKSWAGIKDGYGGTITWKAVCLGEHVVVVDTAVAATCTTSGLTEGSHCSACGMILSAQTAVEALGHDLSDWYDATAATCTTGGTQRRDCSRCDYHETKIIYALGHSEVVDAAAAPTCTAPGKTEGSHCGRCGVVLTAQQTLAALGHAEVIDKAVAPTCTATGLTEGRHCSRCAAVLDAQQVVPMTEHPFGAWTTILAPTCMEAGSESRSCTACGKTESRTVDALGHEEVTDEAVEPTCTAAGLSEGKHCARCEEVLVAQNEISALGHDEVIDAAVAPTCLEPGLTEGRHCQRCREVLVPQTEIGAADHDYHYGICRACGDELPSDHQIFAGKSLTLKPVNPATGKAYTAKELVWEMEEIFEPFATFKSGKLTAKKVVERVRLGVKAKITATGEEISYLVDIYPTVTQLEAVVDGDLTANNASVLMDFTDEARTITVNAYPGDTLARVQWTVSDKTNQYAAYKMDGGTLTVTNPTGKAGTVTIKATVDAGVKKTVTVKVNFGSFARKVEIIEPEKTTLRSGESITLSGYVSDPLVVSKSGLVWTSSDNKVAAVSNGKVTAKNVAHPTLVTITATSKDSQASASIKLKIIPKNEGQLVLMQDGAYVTNGTLAMNFGETIQITASSILDGQPAVADVNWTSTKVTVAHVADGKITATGVGSAKITATADDGRTAVINVKVATLVSAMEITTKDGKNILEENGEKVVLLSSGKNVTLAANILTLGADGAVTWEITEGAEYAKIANGKVTANKDLTSIRYITVKATAKDGSGVSSTIRVKILPLATGVQIFENGNRVRSNTTYISDLTTNPVLKLRARVYPASASQAVILTSSNRKIADFNENGELVCFKTGTVTITATAQDGSKAKTSFKLTIVKKITDLRLKTDANLTVVGGRSLKLAPMVEILPGDATNKKLTWSVAPNDYGIKISASGVLSTKKVTEPVTINVMVRTQDGSGKMLSIHVTVNTN